METFDRVLSIPGKTFFAGEYLALEGGPALVVATKPRFSLHIKKAEGKNPFHVNSPAGVFYQLHENYFSKFDIRFNDPYLGVGGFGASSAQFALLHGLYQLQESLWGESERFFDWHELLKDYRSQVVTEGYPPSGADVVGQCCGGMTYFDRSNGKVQTFAWPFAEYGFYILSTGRKLATHEHLKTIKDIPVQQMDSGLKTIRQGISGVNFDVFKQGLSEFNDSLVAKKWISDSSLEILKKVAKLKTVEFAKGCGAMGEDVILVIYKHGPESGGLATNLEALGLIVRAGENSIDSGLKVEGIYAKV